MLAEAQRCIGMGEVEANNESEWLDHIRSGGPKGAWCAAFVSHCALAAWAHTYDSLGWDVLLRPYREMCPVKRCHGARKLYRSIGKAGRFLDGPKVGAVACWERGRDGWSGHVGIVSEVEGKRFWAIEGNIGAFPAVVTERDVTARPRLIGFAELPSV